MERLLEKFGLQLYSLRDVGPFEEQLKTAKKAGYSYVEFGPDGNLTAEETKSLLDKYELTPLALHIGADALASQTKKFADFALALGVETVIVPFGAVKDKPIKTRKEAQKLAKTVNKAATKLAAYGIKTAYHNHDMEFLRDKDTDERLLDVLIAGFDGKVTLELDVYWAKYAGVDPIDAIEQYKSLITHCHLKDMKIDENGEKDFTDLTDGILDFRRIIETLGPDVEYIVEQDECEGKPYDAVRRAATELSNMATRPINVAVIGLGMIGMQHLDAYVRDPNARVVAVCDNDAVWLRNVKIRYDLPEIYTDYHELLENTEIQAVSVCTPNSTHAEITIAALEAGLDVLVEKPMALCARDGRRMVETAKRTGKKLMVVQNQRFSPAIQKLKQLYSEGKLGNAYYVRAGWQRPVGLIPSPESTRPNGDKVNRNWYNEKNGGGGVLRDLGVHLLDSILYITGFPNATEVLGAGARCFSPMLGSAGDEHDYTSEDFADSMVKFDNGMSVSMEVSFGAPVPGEVKYTDLYCTKGGARRVNDSLDLVRINDDGSCSLVGADLSDVTPFINVNRLFVGALMKGEAMPIDPEECVKVLEIIDRLYESIGNIDNSALTE